MRLSGIHSISKRWPKAARNRAIANLANLAKRSTNAEPSFYVEVLDRIDKLATYDTRFLEQERDYVIKGSRFAQEDVEMILPNNTYKHNSLRHYPKPEQIMPRLTFKYIVAAAKPFDVVVERHGKEIQYWTKGADHTVGSASTLKEAWDDLNANFFKI